MMVGRLLSFWEGLFSWGYVKLLTVGILKTTADLCNAPLNIFWGNVIGNENHLFEARDDNGIIGDVLGIPTVSEC